MASQKTNSGTAFETVRRVQESGIPSVKVKCVDIRGTSVAKAAYWTETDTEARKWGATGLIQ